MSKKRYDFDDATDAVTWWQRNRNKVYGTLLILVGALGGNVDRIPVPASETEDPIEDVSKKISDLEIRLDTHIESHQELLTSMELLEKALLNANQELVKRALSDQ